MKKLKKPLKKFLTPLVKAYAVSGEATNSGCQITQNGCPCPAKPKQKCCGKQFSVQHYYESNLEFANSKMWCKVGKWIQAIELDKKICQSSDEILRTK